MTPEIFSDLKWRLKVKPKSLTMKSNQQKTKVATNLQKRENDKTEILDSVSDNTKVPEVGSTSSTRALSKAVVTSISEDEKLKEETPNWEDYKLIFDKFDSDKNGYLSSDDIRKVLLTYGQLSSEGELQEVVAVFDKKGDGLITLEEFVSIMNSHKSIFSKKDEKDLEFHEVFRVLDKSGTGRVTIQALCEFMAVFEPSFNEDHAFDMVRKFDTKGNGDLCYEDFVKLLTAKDVE